jgi:F0F1-type ATP synthase membrane subunit a
MGTLPQAFKIIFEMQRKKINEKITRKKKRFATLKTHLFFFFFSLDPSYFETL